MKSKEELTNLLNGNKDLLKKLEEAWKNQLSDEEIGKILVESDAGLTMDDVQDLLAMQQKNTLNDLKKEQLDDSQLGAVTGGGDGKCDNTANCDESFLQYPTVPKGQRCIIGFLCDHWLAGDCWVDYTDITK